MMKDHVDSLDNISFNGLSGDDREEAPKSYCYYDVLLRNSEKLDTAGSLPGKPTAVDHSSASGSKLGHVAPSRAEQPREVEENSRNESLCTQRTSTFHQGGHGLALSCWFGNPLLGKPQTRQ